MRHLACPETGATAPGADEPHVVPACNVTANPAKPNKPNRYAAPCVRCGAQVPEGKGNLHKVAGAWKVEHVGPCPATAEDEHRWAEPIAGLDLSELPAGRYAVPGGTRLKLRVDKPETGEWAGWVFVKDAAEYGAGRRYGRQKPGGRYEGDVVEELRAIAADPFAASVAYGLLTETCGVCGRPLADKASVEAGIGPVCRERF